jgi:hypothetical protein
LVWCQNNKVMLLFLFSWTWVVLYNGTIFYSMPLDTSDGGLFEMRFMRLGCKVVVFWGGCVCWQQYMWFKFS